MRKKSHISLARYIVHSLDNQELVKHRKAFYIGSILPDCKPSFLTTKHEFTGTFSMVEDKIRQMISEYDPVEHSERNYAINLGQVLHYIADYFTFPHNEIYDGNLKDHCVYEKELKFGLRAYIKSGEAERVSESMASRTAASEPVENMPAVNVSVEEIDSCDALMKFIKKAHQEYLNMKHSIEKDCLYIVQICQQVAEAILNLFRLQGSRNQTAVYAV